MVILPKRLAGMSAESIVRELQKKSSSQKCLSSTGKAAEDVSEIACFKKIKKKITKTRVRGRCKSNYVCGITGICKRQEMQDFAHKKQYMKVPLRFLWQRCPAPSTGTSKQLPRSLLVTV